MWRGGSRFAAGPVRVYEENRPRSVGGTLSFAGYTIGLARLGTAPCGATRAWYRGCGRFSLGGWRTGRTVPFSTGWVKTGCRRAGVLLTISSRTVYVTRMWTGAEYREHLEQSR
ncbi:hypothetical protein [Streptomyces sp900116325]|uniref:hypothetical protein n=1 Tax=Streptomyces sp. 900116325 TaxID=3154295 RepID=UPI0033B58A15